MTDVYKEGPFQGRFHLKVTDLPTETNYRLVPILILQRLVAFWTSNCKEVGSASFSIHNPFWGRQELRPSSEIQQGTLFAWPQDRGVYISALEIPTRIHVIHTTCAARLRDCTDASHAQCPAMLLGTHGPCKSPNAPCLDCGSLAYILFGAQSG